MDIVIKADHFTAQEELKGFIEEHVEKLGTFHDRIQEVEVSLRLEKDSEHHANKLAEIKLHIPGHQLFASDREHSFEAAIDLTCEKLRKQLIKQREKLYARH